MKWLYTLHQEGKIKELGLTNFDTEHMAKLVEDWDSSCFQSGSVFHYCYKAGEENGCMVLTTQCAASCLWPEKCLGRPEPRRLDLTSSSLSKYKYVIDQWGGWALFQDLLLALSRVANKYKVSISNVALRYIADKPAVAAIIVGARLSISEHIASNQAAYSIPGALKLFGPDRDALNLTLNLLQPSGLSNFRAFGTFAMENSS